MRPEIEVRTGAGARARPVQIRTPDQRLRVFVSSTLQELAAERAAAREAIEQLRMTPVMFETGARPHPPRALYRAYLEQSDVFVGMYWQRYGWVAPDEEVSGLEDEYRLSAGRPRLLYVKAPAARREPRLAGLLRRIQADDTASYKPFSDPAELGRLLTDDLALLLSERFIAGTSSTTGLRLDLPSPATRLVGRAAEVDRISGIFADPTVRLVTLTGAGGVGKTRLAIAIAEQLRDRDGVEVGFLSLAPVRDPTLVPAAIAAGLGIQSGPGDVEDRVIAALRERSPVLVLDNFEQVVGAAPFVARLLTAAPHVRILATSREPLRIGAERAVSISPLAVQSTTDRAPDGDVVAPAVQLFVERAEAIRAGATHSGDSAVLTELVTRLDGLPLAIELAAAQMRLFTPQALLQRLSSRLALLTTGARDLPERQRTLRATLDWSHDLLTSDEQRVFARLSVFRGGARLGEVERVCEAGLTGDILDHVAALVDKSLVRTLPTDGDPRVGMLETVREYAAQQLNASGELKAIEELRDEAYLAMVTRARAELRGPRQTETLRTLEGEIDNLRAVAERAGAIGRADLTVRLVWEAWQFWWLKGHLDESRRWLDEVARSGALERLGEPERTQFHAAQALILFWSARHKDAVRHADAAIEGLRSSGDLPNTALLLLVRGMSVALSGGDLASGRDDVSEARRIEESLGATWLAGFVWNAEGYLANLAGDTDATVAALERAAVESEHSGELAGALVAFDTLGHIYLAKGDLDRSADGFRRALKIGLQAGLSERFGYVLMGVAGLCHVVGDDEAAARYIGAAEAARETVTATWLFPDASAEWNLLRSQIRASLGEAGYEAADAEGRAAGTHAMAEQAIARLAGLGVDQDA
jgi:predicted ATPase